MTGTDKEPDGLKAGRVLSGGKIKTDSPFLLLIKERYQNGRTAAHLHERGQPAVPTAPPGRRPEGHGHVAKSDKLPGPERPEGLPPQPSARYFQVVRLLPMYRDPRS